MQREFSYPAKAKKYKDGYVVTFVDFPEAVTQGDSLKEALSEAVDCLEEVIANRMQLKLPIPKPSPVKRVQHHVNLHATLAAKAALYLAMRASRMTNVALAKKLDCDEKEVRRLIDPYYSSKFPKIEYALNQLGKQLHVSVLDYV